LTNIVQVDGMFSFVFVFTECDVTS